MRPSPKPWTWRLRRRWRFRGMHRLKAKEIVEQSGANSETRFIQVVVGDVTFREQAEVRYLAEA
jgi:hypothetical protein